MAELNRQTAKQDETPRIYVACLASYNAGTLSGRWIDATLGVDGINAEIQAMLKASPEPFAEEYAIHDYEGFEWAEISEYCGVEQVARLAEFIEEHGKLGAELLNHFGGDMGEAEAAFENYAGEYLSLADFAEDLTGETTQIPESLVNYIDYEAMGRDMDLNGDVLAIEAGFEQVHIFWSR